MIYAGTSGWAYPNWRPDFYPAKLGTAKFLQHYASRLNTVEVNYTFRHLPSEKTLTGWIESTPETFRFAIKASQRITHIRRLQDCEREVATFIGCLAPLAQSRRLGPILFQLPPNLKCDMDRLESFLGWLPRSGDCRCTMEFRHDSWLNDAVYDLLRRYGVALCVAESEDRDTPDVTTGPFAYYRLRKGEYSDAERTAIRKRVADHAQAGRDVYCFFKHEDTPQGALYAEELLQGIAQQRHA